MELVSMLFQSAKGTTCTFSDVATGSQFALSTGGKVHAPDIQLKNL
jgi:hypothetical protein